MSAITGFVSLAFWNGQRLIIKLDSVVEFVQIYYSDY